MALKYWFTFTDVEEIVHLCEISDENFTGDSTQIYGSCSLEYSETDDTLEPIRGSGLQIDLLADSDLSFSDLYSEDERTFKVTYKRNEITLFNGWLSPDGLYENMVSDKWTISLDCVDGLGFLSNLSYVNDSTGLNFVGKQSLLEIIVNCLKRTKTPQNILTSNDIYYIGLDQTLNTFDNVYFNANRFIKEDEDTNMDCDEVLRSVLEPFGAVITSYKGQWLIYQPTKLHDSNTLDFFRYDDLGNELTPTTETIDFTLDLGSQVNKFYPHHVNENQQKTIKKSIGAYRINYKYGLVKSFFTNTLLESSMKPPLIVRTVDEWTINDDTYLDFPSDEKGLLLKSITSEDSPIKIITSDSFTFEEGNQITYLTISNTEYGLDFSIRSRVILTDGTSVYHLTYNGEWVTSQPFIFAHTDYYGKDRTTTVNSDRMPISGDVYVELYTPIYIEEGDLPPTLPNVLIKKCIFSPYEQDLDDVSGENHTFQRIAKPSANIQDTKEVYNGDNPSDTYIGTIYKADEETTTDENGWTRKGLTETKNLLQIMGEERMKMYAKPLQQYSGDVYGYFNYLSRFTIDGLNGVFQPTTYKYDAKTNVTDLVLTEILNTDILNDVDYVVTLDRGNVVEPTIKG